MRSKKEEAKRAQPFWGGGVTMVGVVVVVLDFGEGEFMVGATISRTERGIQ